MFAAQGQLNGFGPGHIAAQNSDVIEIRQSNGTVAYLWSADLWFSAESGLKGDDHQYWEPLGWAEAAVPGLPEPVPVPHRTAAAGQCASPPFPLAAVRRTAEACEWCGWQAYVAGLLRA